MPRRSSRDIVHRWEGNPLLTIDDLSFRCNIIRNAGAIKVDGEYILLITIQSLKGVHRIYAARGKDRYHFEVDPAPLMEPSCDPGFAPYEEMGVLDPRIVTLEGQHYISYDALGPHGYVLGLARTADFRSVERLGIVSQPDTKCGALFPQKIGGKYARLERPSAGGSIWVSYSDDLDHWGWSEVVMTPRGGFWDQNRVGVSTPPMPTPEGWLLVYYGVKATSAGPLIRMGAVVLDRDDPARVVGRTNVPVLSPREPWERIGEVQNLVYSCGAIVEPNGELDLYYGAANSCISLGTAPVEALLSACLDHGVEY